MSSLNLLGQDTEAVRTSRRMLKVMHRTRLTLTLTLTLILTLTLTRALALALTSQP